MFLVPIFKVNIDLHINAFLSEKVAMHKKRKDGWINDKFTRFMSTHKKGINYHIPSAIKHHQKLIRIKNQFRCQKLDAAVAMRVRE